MEMQRTPVVLPFITTTTKDKSHYNLSSTHPLDEVVVISASYSMKQALEGRR
jgi:hypothetical protein